MNYHFANAMVASGYPLDLGVLAVNLILTVAIYSLPIIIYRYAVRREPVSPKKGKIITIVYGISAWIVVTAIKSASGTGAAAGSAIFLWSYVNYSMLTKGWVQHRDTVTARQEREEDVHFNGAFHTENIEEDQIPVPAEREKEKSKQPKYCDLCGNKLHEDDEFCDSCGARITSVSEE